MTIERDSAALHPGSILAGPRASTPEETAGDGDLDDARLVARVGAATVQLTDGKTVRLRELWSGQPAVIAFVRQFGCLFCHELVHSLAASAEKIASKRARLVIVGNGSVEQAAKFFLKKGLPVAGVVVATDPTRESYRAAELERGVAKTFFHEGARQAYVRARREGFAITGAFGSLGDTFQLGGILVVSPGSRLVFRHASRFAGDNPSMDEVIAALG